MNVRVSEGSVYVSREGGLVRVARRAEYGGEYPFCDGSFSGNSYTEGGRFLSFDKDHPLDLMQPASPEQIARFEVLSRKEAIVPRMGHTYVMRDGNSVKLHPWPGSDATWPIVGVRAGSDCDDMWTLGGYFQQPGNIHPYDIVEEYSDQPSKPTAKDFKEFAEGVLGASDLGDFLEDGGFQPTHENLSTALDDINAAHQKAIDFADKVHETLVADVKRLEALKAALIAEIAVLRGEYETVRAARPREMQAGRRTIEL